MSNMKTRNIFFPKKLKTRYLNLTKSAKEVKVPSAFGEVKFNIYCTEFCEVAYDASDVFLIPSRETSQLLVTLGHFKDMEECFKPILIGYNNLFIACFNEIIQNSKPYIAFEKVVNKLQSDIKSYIDKHNYDQKNVRGSFSPFCDFYDFLESCKKLDNSMKLSNRAKKELGLTVA